MATAQWDFCARGNRGSGCPDGGSGLFVSPSSGLLELPEVGRSQAYRYLALSLPRCSPKRLLVRSWFAVVNKCRSPCLFPGVEGRLLFDFGRASGAKEVNCVEDPRWRMVYR